MELVRENTKCRACGFSLGESVIDLGSQYVVDFVPNKEVNTLRVPLELTLCPDCLLLQLRHSVHPDRLYKKFWYRSGINESMRQALSDVANDAAMGVGLQPGDNVLDIGCNDGTLLSFYPEEIVRVGIDPAAEIVEEAIKKCRVDVGIADYFNAEAVRPYGPFKIITAIAMFYDLEDPGKFLGDCLSVLAEDGLIVLQLNYLKSMISNFAFDNICHEHLTYFGILSLNKLVQRMGLEIVGVQENGVNGGSFRVYIMRPGQDLNPLLLADKRVSAYTMLHSLIYQESKNNFDNPSMYKAWGKKVEKFCEAIRNAVQHCIEDDKRVYCYGASTRGSTLMQSLALPANSIIACAERDEKKYGLKTVGTWMDIKSEEECRKDADVFLVQPYHFWDAIKRRERVWLEDGGQFIVPLPHPRLVSAHGSRSLITGAPMPVEVVQ